MFSRTTKSADQASPFLTDGRTKAVDDDPLFVNEPSVQRGPRFMQSGRNPEELDALWTQTRLPEKYRASISDEELEAMAYQAEQDGVPLRSVVTDQFRRAKEQQEYRQFEEMPAYRHNFFTATHRTGFGFSPWKHLWQIFLMTFFPWLLFLGIGVMFIYLYYPMPWITLLIIFLIGALSFLVLLSGAMSNDFGRAVYGILFLIATVTACLAGFENYSHRLFHYWSANEGRQYTNVRSDSLAAAHADAGVLVFTDEAVVDTTKTIGYKSGETYCVAPISRKDQSHASVIQYWAAGVDCCNGRGFFSCDDATDKAAKSGLVIREQASSIFFKSELDYYMHAVEMSTEVYGLTAAKELFFVRWTTDVDAKAETYLISGWMHWGYYGVAFLVCDFILALLFYAVICQQKNKEAEKKDNFAVGKDEKVPLTQGPGFHRTAVGRWASMDAPVDQIHVDRRHIAENDLRGIDTSTLPRTANYQYQQPTPTFSNGLPRLDETHDSIATIHEPYGPNYSQGLDQVRGVPVTNQTQIVQGVPVTTH
jgi:hypothetical protein